MRYVGVRMTSTTSFPPLLVVAAVVLRDGRVLLTKRRAGTHLGGSWEFPGGKVEPGETPRGALERELEEELGVVANVGEAFAFNDHTYSDRHVLLLTYLTGIRGEPSPVGCDEVRWCDAAEVTRLTMPPADRPIIERLIPLLSGGSVG